MGEHAPTPDVSAARAPALVALLLLSPWLVPWSRAIAGPGGERRARPPNVLVVLADDMGFSDVGCYGGEISTPNIDRLAAGGLRFSQFYNTGRCCPTRASLLTGLYPHQAGVGHMMSDRGHAGYRGDLGQDTVTLAEVLAAAGYHTWMAGKWHVTKQIGHWAGNGRDSKHNWPRQRGFERFYGTIHGAGSFYDPVTLTRGNTPIEPEGDDYYYTDAISDAAVDFVREHAASGSGRPFFGYVAYTAPHWPLHAPAAAVERYRGRYRDGWDALRQARLTRMRAMGLVDERWQLTPRDARVPAWDAALDRAWHERAMEVYAAQITLMDEGLGRIVAALEAAHELDDTLILFLADNGGCAEGIANGARSFSIPTRTRDGREVTAGNRTGLMPGPEGTYQSYGRPWANASNTPFRLYKHWVHEGGIATPLIVHWPAGFEARDEWREQPAHLIDVMTTCVDASGATYPRTFGGRAIRPMEGMTLLPAMGGAPVVGRALFWEHEGNRALRVGDWKLVARHREQGARWELYDMDADRTEREDLAGSQPERVQRMAAMWDAWAERCGVQPWPVRAPRGR